MPRIARIVFPEYPHHVVQRGNNRQTVFFDGEDRELYLVLLKKYSNECCCKVKAYCLMDNHVHILLVPQDSDSLAKIMQKISLTFTQYFNRKYKRTGRLWECRFYSSPVDADSYLWAVCRYIEKNPIRAKLVERPADYRWSSAKVNTSINYQDGIVDPVWRNYLSLGEYVKFLDQAGAEEQVKDIRKSAYKGIPFGSSLFINNISRRLGIAFEAKQRGRPRNK